MDRRFFKSVSTLLTGTLLAQLLVFLASPVLSRLYSPEHFGVFGLFTAVAGVVAMASAFKYELAVVLPAEDKDALHLVQLSLGLALFGSLIVGFGVFLFTADVLELPENVKGLREVLWWLVPTVFALSALQTLSYWAARKRRFGIIASSTISRNLGVIGVQLLGGVLKVSAIGLILGQLVGALIAGVWLAVKTLPVAQIFDFRPERTLDLCKEHRRFPMLSAPTSLINSLSQHLPTFVLSIFFGVVPVGLYWFAQKVLEAPMTALGGAVRQVYFQDIAALKANGEPVYDRWKRVSLMLCGIGLIPVAILVPFGPQLFEFIFGLEWNTAGEFSRWLVLWIAAGFMNSPSVMAIHVFQLQRMQLGHEVVLFCARAGALLLGGYLGDVVVAIALFSIVGAIANLVLIGLVGMEIRRQEATIEGS